MSLRFPFDSVILRFAEPERRHKRLRELVGYCERLCEGVDARRRVEALTDLFAFLARPDKSLPGPSDGSANGVPPQWRRVAVWVAILESDEGARAAFGAALAHIVSDTEAMSLFAEAGLPNDRGLVNEMTDRLFRRILPQPRDEHDLGRLVTRLFPREPDLRRVEQIPAALFARVFAVLSYEQPVGEAMIAAAADAFSLLAVRAQALGLSEEVRTRSASRGKLANSPFFRLPRACDAFVAAHAPEHEGDAVVAARTVAEEIAACRIEIRSVLAHLEATGVSVDVVYGLDAIEQSFVRMEALMELLASPAGESRAHAAQRLLVALVRARLSDRSLRDLFAGTTRLLARKIIERAGRTGEHYIAATRREYFHLLGTAAGGGVLTCGTATMKVLITGQHFPLFVEFFVSGSNYALSFILMQILGFTLATKQPSMTAATLAGVIRDTAGPSRNEELVSTVARIVRSQLAAAAGNIAAVSVTALLLDLVFQLRGSGHFLPAEKAAKTLASLHPLSSGTIFYAALTGVVLWLSSLAAGWAENFAVYRRLPQAVAEHPFGRVVGEGFMAKVAGYFAKHVSGWGGSIALGFMLALVPAIGIVFGLPLDVRHVTLSSGVLVLSAATYGLGAVTLHEVWWAVAGIAVIFSCNLGVSFLLALTVALRARAVPTRDRWALLRVLLGRLFTSPAQFFFPPRTDETLTSPHEPAVPVAVHHGQDATTPHTRH